MNSLPIDAVLPDIKSVLTHSNRLILQAPPGAGKSTRVPLSLLEEPWLESRQIWLLEPRRIAARQVASRMAQSMGESVGQTIGLVTGHENQVGKTTRLVVMTEAILTNRLLSEQDIPDCAAVIFDEFHERNIHSDLGLALAYDSQQCLRDDLRLIVMSATLATERLAEQFDASVVQSEGRTFPIEHHYLGAPESRHKLPEHTVKAIRKGCAEVSGHILVFLPGMAEINQCLHLLEAAPVEEHAAVYPLHGQLSAKEQSLALSNQSAKLF